MGDDHPELLTFPCRITVKALGRQSPALLDTVLRIATRHYPELDPAGVMVRPSAKHRYASINIRVRADSRRQIDALYHDLSACDQILMLL